MAVRKNDSRKAVLSAIAEFDTEIKKGIFLKPAEVLALRSARNKLYVLLMERDQTDQINELTKTLAQMIERIKHLEEQTDKD